MIAVWDELPVRNLISLQRIAAVKTMEREVRRLLIEGYTTDADRKLDELIEYKRRLTEGSDA